MTIPDRRRGRRGGYRDRPAADRGRVTGGSTPASTDDIMAAVTLLGRKTDTLIAQIGIVMTQQDEVNAAVAALGQAVTDLTTTVEAEIDPHQPGVTAGWVDSGPPRPPRPRPRPG